LTEKTRKAAGLLGREDAGRASGAGGSQETRG